MPYLVFTTTLDFTTNPYPSQQAEGQGSGDFFTPEPRFILKLFVLKPWTLSNITLWFVLKTLGQMVTEFRLS